MNTICPLQTARKFIIAGVRELSLSHGPGFEIPRSTEHSLLRNNSSKCEEMSTLLPQCTLCGAAHTVSSAAINVTEQPPLPYLSLLSPGDTTQSALRHSGASPQPEMLPSVLTPGSRSATYTL
jgi:hypothetical protein